MRAHGRAKVSSRSPQAFAICDACGFLFNHVELRWQMDWAGNKLINKRQLVCRRCNDIPQSQLRAIVLPADPVPVKNPRTQNYEAASGDIRVTYIAPVIDPVTGLPIPQGATRITQNDQRRVIQEIGDPLGLDPDVSSFPAIPFLSIMASGPYTVNVTTSPAHGLVTGDSIGVEGVTLRTAAGAFTVLVTSPTAFQYSTNKIMQIGSISTNYTRIVKMIIGLPRNMDSVPKTGN
jgi:hypothetical protein